MNNFIKNLIFFLFILLIQDSLFAQVSIKREYPVSIEKKLDINIPEIILPEINYRNIRKIEQRHRASRLKSLRFAEMINVDIDIKRDGVLTILPDGSKLWLLKIKSKKAYSLSVYFDLFVLSNKAELYIYNSGNMSNIGAFTSSNNKLNKHLAIAPVKGDEIVIEYFEPQNIKNNVQLHISRIGHDYKDVFSLLNKDVKGFGSSGSCNVDINCDEGNGWQKEKHSVCKITYNGWMCSGALINNARNDGKPYFLTANHCIDSQADADAAIFYFNYESPECNGEDGPLDQTVSGAKLVATAPDGKLDFSLLELSIPPPPEYKPYYSGWNRESNHALKTTCIHHPSGDVKKITIDYNAPEIGNYGEGYDENSHWWIKEWDIGTTEGGSSGAPLFDENHKIIGDLTGGDASCSYNYNDYFAMFSRSWNDYSAESNQLQKWLDPYNTGIVSLKGKEAYDSVPSNLIAFEKNNSIKLMWLPSSDTLGFKKYFIYRNTVLIDSTVNIEYIDLTCEQNVPYEYKVAAVFKIDIDTSLAFSNKVSIRLMTSLGIPYVQNFELSDSMPEYWYQTVSNDTVLWEFRDGGNISPSGAYEGNMNAFFQNNNNDTAILISPKFDFNTINNALLEFYIAMPQNNNDVHILNVLYKEADSLNWKLLITYSHDIPLWEKQVINLPNLSHQYQIAFEGIGNRGYGICLDSISLAQDFNPIVPEFIANKSEICLSDSVQYVRVSGSDEDSYYWYFGEDATIVDTVGIGPFTVKYNNPGLKHVSLTVNNTYTTFKPDIVRCMPIPPKPSFCINGDTLESTSAYFYQWYINGDEINGATSKNIKITESAYYSVETINEYDCSNMSDSIYVLVNDIEDIYSWDEGIKIFPNPNSGSFEITTDNVIDGRIIVSIFDINGSIVFEKQFDNINQQLINSNINQSGIYFVEIRNNEFVVHAKIIIKKGSKQ